jgi:hypothetical protein
MPINHSANNAHFAYDIVRAIKVVTISGYRVASAPVFPSHGCRCIKVALGGGFAWFPGINSSHNSVLTREEYTRIMYMRPRPASGMAHKALRGAHPFTRDSSSPDGNQRRHLIPSRVSRLRLRLRAHLSPPLRLCPSSLSHTLPARCRLVLVPHGPLRACW